MILINLSIRINYVNLMKKIFPKIIILVLILIIAIGLWYYANSIPRVKNLIELATTVKPETFTELYFENHLNLPNKVVIDKKYSYAFTLHNLENKDMIYPYETYIASDESKLDLSKGSVFIKKDGYATIHKDFTLKTELNRVMVVVNLIKKNQQIDFWIEK